MVVFVLWKRNMEPELDESQLEAGYSDTPAVVPEPVVVEPPKVDDSMKVLMDRFDKLEVRTRNTEGHIGGLNHQQKLLQETLQAASKAATNAASDAPTQAQVHEAMKNPQKWDALTGDFPEWGDRKSTRLNSSHANISYAVFC